MRIDAQGNCEQQTWWNLNFGPQREEIAFGLDEWRERVLDGMREAVSIRQRAAVDVGVLLSGGVDSSMLVGLLSREVAKHCKVVQSGQGADELFAGYHWYPQVDAAEDAFGAYRAAFFDRDYDEYAACVQPAWLTGDMAGGGGRGSVCS